MLNPFIRISGHHFYRPSINSKSIIIDLGANLGYFSNTIHDIFHCKSHMVDPMPIFREVVPFNENFIKHHYAINSKNEPIYFSNNLWHQDNGIYNVPTDDKNRFLADGITLETFLIKNSLNKVDLLKVDIEGAEIELFESTSNETFLKIKQLSIEFHDFIKSLNQDKKIKEIISRMKNLGFICIIFSKDSLGDTLFIRPNFIERISISIFLFLRNIKKYFIRINK